MIKDYGKPKKSTSELILDYLKIRVPATFQEIQEGLTAGVEIAAIEAALSFLVRQGFIYKSDGGGGEALLFMRIKDGYPKHDSTLRIDRVANEKARIAYEGVIKYMVMCGAWQACARA